MSYDMSIGDEDFNYTYNVAPMWYASEPELGIRAIYGSTGREAECGQVGEGVIMKARRIDKPLSK